VLFNLEQLGTLGRISCHRSSFYSPRIRTLVSFTNHFAFWSSNFLFPTLIILTDVSILAVVAGEEWHQCTERLGWQPRLRTDSNNNTPINPTTAHMPLQCTLHQVWSLSKQAIHSTVTMDITDTTSIKVKTMTLSFNNQRAHISVVAKMFIKHQRDHHQGRSPKGMGSFGKLMDVMRQIAKFQRAMSSGRQGLNRWATT
jgi:hypothetical protein